MTKTEKRNKWIPLMHPRKNRNKKIGKKMIEYKR
jgi:hypothetical protein